MKVKIIVGKYKAADENWYKFGEVVDLPESEGRAAIAGNVAIEMGSVISPPVQNIAEPVSETAARVRGTSSKKE